MSPEVTSDARRNGFGDPRSSAPRERFPTPGPSARDGELAEELAMAAFVVVGFCLLLLAAIGVAYCSGKAPVCRELLDAARRALR